MNIELVCSREDILAANTASDLGCFAGEYLNESLVDALHSLNLSEIKSEDDSSHHLEQEQTVATSQSELALLMGVPALQAVKYKDVTISLKMKAQESMQANLHKEPHNFEAVHVAAQGVDTDVVYAESILVAARLSKLLEVGLEIEGCDQSISDVVFKQFEVLVEAANLTSYVAKFLSSILGSKGQNDDVAILGKYRVLVADLDESFKPDLVDLAVIYEIRTVIYEIRSVSWQQKFFADAKSCLESQLSQEDGQASNKDASIIQEIQCSRERSEIKFVLRDYKVTGAFYRLLHFVPAHKIEQNQVSVVLHVPNWPRAEFFLSKIKDNHDFSSAWVESSKLSAPMKIQRIQYHKDQVLFTGLNVVKTSRKRMILFYFKTDICQLTMAAKDVVRDAKKAKKNRAHYGDESVEYFELSDNFYKQRIRGESKRGPVLFREVKTHGLTFGKIFGLNSSEDAYPPIVKKQGASSRRLTSTALLGRNQEYTKKVRTKRNAGSVRSAAKSNASGRSAGGFSVYGNTTRLKYSQSESGKSRTGQRRMVRDFQSQNDLIARMSRSRVPTLSAVQESPETKAGSQAFQKKVGALKTVGGLTISGAVPPAPQSRGDTLQPTANERRQKATLRTPVSSMSLLKVSRKSSRARQTAQAAENKAVAANVGKGDQDHTTKNARGRSARTKDTKVRYLYSTRSRTRSKSNNGGGAELPSRRSARDR